MIVFSPFCELVLLKAKKTLGYKDCSNFVFQLGFILICKHGKPKQCLIFSYNNVIFFKS